MTAAPTAGPTRGRSAVLARRIRWIVGATIGYNVIEAVVALAAGTAASSSALVAFGLDSLVEVLSAAAVAWQFAAPDPHRRERAALRLIAVSFFGLAAFVSVDAVRTLSGAEAADHSPVGIGLAAVSVAVMPVLSWLERRTGKELGSASAVADSRQTLLCSYLSGVLLVGLVLNGTLGWTWADPVAALVIAAVAVREGLEAWRGDACCTPVAQLVADGGGGTGDGGACGADACAAPDPAVPGGDSEWPAETATLTCPECGTATPARMPVDACQFFWECPACRSRLRPLEGDCCVFCSYGSRPCPPRQADAAG